MKQTSTFKAETELIKALEEAAYQRRTTMSAIIRESLLANPLVIKQLRKIKKN